MPAFSALGCIIEELTLPTTNEARSSIMHRNTENGWVNVRRQLGFPVTIENYVPISEFIFFFYLGKFGKTTSITKFTGIYFGQLIARLYLIIIAILKVS